MLWLKCFCIYISFIISVWFVQGTPVRTHIMDDRALHGLSPLAGRQEQAQVSTVQAFVFFLIHDIYIVYSRVAPLTYIFKTRPFSCLFEQI